MEENCIFCKIIKGEIPCYKIYEDENTLAFLDIAKDAVGHTLVIPKKHYTNILDCSESDISNLFNVVKKISKHYVDDCGFSGINIINANGIDAQQTVFHLHIHIIPRKENDGMDIWALKEKLDINMEEICNKLKFK